MAEKCTATLPPLRITDKLETALMWLAAHEDRTLSDYIRRALELHTFGHAAHVAATCGEIQHDSASQGDAR